MELTRRDAVIIAGAATLAAPASSALAAGRPAGHVLINQKAPPFDLPKVGGARAKLSDYKGKTLVLMFYGQWCGDCMRDAPQTAALVRAMAEDKRLAFLGIHTRGNFGRWGDVPTFFKEMGWSFPAALDDDSSAYKTYQMQWVPGFLVIDTKGIIRVFANDLVAGGGKGVAGFLGDVRAVAARKA
jgi:peroxiredoxin